MDWSILQTEWNFFFFSSNSPKLHLQASNENKLVFMHQEVGQSSAQTGLHKLARAGSHKRACREVPAPPHREGATGCNNEGLVFQVPAAKSRVQQG